jgi:hypothetical protein
MGGEKLPKGIRKAIRGLKSSDHPEAAGKFRDTYEKTWLEKSAFKEAGIDPKMADNQISGAIKTWAKLRLELRNGKITKDDFAEELEGFKERFDDVLDKGNVQEAMRFITRTTTKHK